jgi:hypothetical protein
MNDRILKGDVESAVRDLNAAAKALGLARHFEVRWGSGSNGVSHEVLERHPSLSHPTATPIGKNYRDAERYLVAMRHALQSAKFDRDYRAEEVRTGGAPSW